MPERTCLCVILAAGEGTRMRSARAKVLHQVAGRALISHVLHATRDAGDRTIVVVGPQQPAVAAEIARADPPAEIVIQEERRGTAHAVLRAGDAIAAGVDDVVIVFGDTPLIRSQTLKRLRAALADGSSVAVVGFVPSNPAGYGRLIIEDGQLVAIREDKDASPVEREIGFCNGGAMALAGKSAMRILTEISDRNAKREFYLTEAVEIARRMSLKCTALEAGADEVLGVNTRTELASAERVMQGRLRNAALDAGVTMTDPDTVFLAFDTRLAPDVTIEPHVVFGPGVTVEDGAQIRGFSHLEGAHVGANAIIGPFARLRPGTRVGASARIGNFVETKAAAIETGAKVNHLTYIGDARVGAGANIGAGTITCNYDGATKHHTDIGEGAFIGSNSALVAPVRVGEGAYVGSGSVITQDVPPGALAVGRARQVIKENWSERLRALRNLGASQARAKRK